MSAVNDDLAVCSMESDHYPIELRLIGAQSPTELADSTVVLVSRIKWDANKEEQYAVMLQDILKAELGDGCAHAMTMDDLNHSLNHCMLSAAGQCMHS